MVSVRRYESRDLAALREICVRTGYRGTDATGVMADTAILPDAYAEPYVVHDPGLAFVADDGGAAVGYIVGTADTDAFADWFAETWLPRVAPKHAAPPEHPDNFEEAILRDLHFVAFDLEPRAESVREIGIVFDNENAGHGDWGAVCRRVAMLDHR